MYDLSDEVKILKKNLITGIMKSGSSAEKKILNRKSSFKMHRLIGEEEN